MRIFIFVALLATLEGVSAFASRGSAADEAVDACGIFVGGMRSGALPRVQPNNAQNESWALLCKCRKGMAAKGISVDKLNAILPGAASVNCAAEPDKLIKVAGCGYTMHTVDGPQMTTKFKKDASVWCRPPDCHVLPTECK